MRLEGKGAVVTGASRGLGRALALALAEAGCRVALVAREEGPLDAAVAAVRARGGTAVGIPADMGAAADVDRAVAEALSALGTVDLLVSNASTLGPVPMPLLLDLTPGALERVLAVNLVGPFRMARVLAGPMALRGEGTVVHLSSDAAVAHYPGWGAYGASKAALDHLGGTLAAELEGTGVRVLVVDPGEMDTRMHARALPEADRSTLADPADVAARIVAMIGSQVPSGSRLEAASWGGR